uniref:VWFD domain-containing protein n=1 Tax=Ciona savignyi TaxID=51511 RepID=H2ZP84_CIOSA
CRLLLSEAFRACHHVIDPKEYVQRCMMDVCSCDGDTQCACATFTHYSRACAYMGVVLSWRNSDTCGVVCDGGKIYSECGSACPVTCENPDMTQECSSNVCVDGCHCPIGTVYDTTTNTCVTRDNCPCTKAGDVYQHGDVIKQDCNNCTCSGGRWNCTDAPCPALCSVIGEDHYVTFDGRRYQFAGGCEYVLVQTKPNDVRPFAVWVQNRGCGFYDDDSCKKSISLKIAGSAVYQMTSNGHVTMGNKELVLPHRDSTLTFHRLSSSFLRMTSSEVEVTWDGAHRIYVKVPPRMKNRLEGLCGVYNLNQADDYRTPTSAITINVAEFGNSWKTDISCSSNQVSTGISVDACVIATSYLTHANVMCSVLKLAFESCNNLVDPSPYVTMCQHDVCHCLHKFNADAQSCRCTVLSAYARACALAGRAIQSSWRDTTSCPVTCTQGRVWDECNNDNCDVTCQMISNANQCNAVSQWECVEGCRCPVGQVFDESIDYCVNKSDCSCYYRNAVYTHGSSREAMCATCRCDGGLWKCESTAGCTRESMCQDGKVWSNCTECQRTCDNMHTSCVQLECHEGCSCPNGTVLSDGKCVTPDHCPCHYRGKSYRDGSWVKQDCNFCRCRNTNWECTERECPAYCSAYGDPHYETFDKRRYEFHGDCTYVLAEDYCGDGVGSFKVTVENVPCSTGGVTCTKALTLYDTIIQMIRGAEPIVSKNPFARPGSPKAEFKITRAGLFLIVKTKIGLTILWDVGTRVYVKLEPKFKRKVCGLCGDFDGNALNDFKTRQGELEASSHMFGDTWKVYSSCPRSEEDPVHPCIVSPQRADWARFACRVIRESPFSSCHAFVDPEPFYQSCLWDSCGCDRGGDCECMCTAIAAYTRECNEAGVHIRWRATGSC